MNIAKLNAPIIEQFEYTDALTGETDTIEVQFKRMSFGISASKAFRQAIDEQDSDAISEMLAQLLSSWNLDANGEAFPPTAENIRACPVEFISQLSEQVFKRLFPNPPSAEKSPDGSAQKESTTDAATA